MEGFKKLKKMLNTTKGHHMGRKKEDMKKVMKEGLKLNEMDEKLLKNREKRYEDKN